MNTQELLESVDWQGLGEYVTNGGKQKEIVTGIPKSDFWRLWSRSKDELKKLGVTVKAEKARGTGSFYVRDGIQHERQAKSWEVVLWINNANRKLMQEMDLTPF